MSPVFLFPIICLISLVSAAPTYFDTYCPNTTSFPSTNTALRSSYDTLLSTLSAAANVSSTPGFHNTTVGSPAVYGLYMCRGDDDATTCRDCVAAASTELSQNCSLIKQAVIWYDQCMIRYSDASFFSQLDDNLSLQLMNTQNVTGNLTQFNQVLSKTLNDVANKAARGTATLKFGTEKAKFNEFQTVYVLGQCTPDLSASDCYTCLQQSVGVLSGGNLQGGRVFYFSCNLRYEIYSFYKETISPAPAPTPTDSSSPSFNRTTAAASVDGKLPQLMAD